MLFLPLSMWGQMHLGQLSVAPQGNLWSKADSIISSGMEFIGRKYRSPRPDGGIFDCSGFLQYIYKSHQVLLPRTSSAMGQEVKAIPLTEVKPGDLLFFKGRDKHSSRIGHVGMVASCGPNGIRMMHSCSRGIRVDSLSMPYYKDRLLFAGRILFETKAASSLALNTQQEPDTLWVLGVGDMMLGTHFPKRSYLPPQDGKTLLEPVHSILQSADFTMGNLEGVLLSGKGKVKSCRDTQYCYAFKMPDHYGNYFKEAGFDALSLANNHTNDFGAEGKTNTRRILDSLNIAYAGLTETPYALIEMDSVKYGFCAFSPNRGTCSITDTAEAQAIVQHLDSLADVVIVSFHGGGEGFDFQNITDKTETYLGENRGNPYRFARAVIDAGADVVFGHGPHLPRAVDLYKGRFIAYSLGNFATYARFNLRGAKGYAPMAMIAVNKQGRFLEGRIVSALQRGEGGPKPDPEQRAYKEIRRLTEADFPNGPIRFEEDGRFFAK